MKALFLGFLLVVLSGCNLLTKVQEACPDTAARLEKEVQDFAKRCVAEQK